ncbi:hypothetical protein LPJ61_001016 [Coemansia biformis]|uniref:Gluconokinase n=1 Tax=Coemansia biformis TaxID=1286918 RepID=A0A9W7YHK3_9FUNG|nr:hypothetical protein LPJ61_001016 [Coemansia biformis]
MLVSDSVVVYPVHAVVVMGVSGCGKTSVGSRLAQLLGNARFIDADSLHSQLNVSKMTQGIPLTDGDRWPWLKRVREQIQAEAGTLVTAQGSWDDSRHGADTRPMYVVCACSALKRSYRELLSRGDLDAAAEEVLHDTLFVHLSVDREVLAHRLGSRTNHFLGSQLLESQLSALEPPDGTREAAMVVDGNRTLDAVVDDVYARIQSRVATVAQQVT